MGQLSMDYVNVVFHTPLWLVSDITVTFACLANSNYGCSLSGETHKTRVRAQTHCCTGRLTARGKTVLISFRGINVIEE